MNNPLGTLLEETQVVINDGAMATELEKQGVNTNNALWSAMALIDRPEAVIRVHRSYFDAGANIATTNSYQANPDAFAKIGLTEAQSDQLIRQTVLLADAARREYLAELAPKARFARERQLLIAGSVGPYGAFLADGSEYTGAYSLTDAAFRDFHWRRMALLESTGADFFAFETMPNFAEIKALTGLLHDEFPDMTAWVALSVGDDPTHLCDGTSIATVVDYLNQQAQVVAIGVNCTAMPNVTAAIRQIATVTAKPIVVYPNNGDIYNPVDKSWRANPDATTLADSVTEWQKAGANIIGGCCRTTPADIKALSERI